MQIILILAMFVLFFVGFNRLMGYRENHITIDLDERYIDYSKYVQAIESELVKQGREVLYKGNGKFMIDGHSYIFIERNVSMGGVPLHRTILKPEK